jgi:hypothetical protein
MPNNNNNLINEYFDKSYITSILCELSYSYYSFLYQMLIFPTILSSSVLTVLNSSSIDENAVKIINITINGMNTVLLAINSNFKFTFDNDAQLSNAERSGYIESYDIVRICVKRLDNGNQIDYPIKTREDYMKTVSRLNERSNEYDMIEIYQDTHMFDIQDYI